MKGCGCMILKDIIDEVSLPGPVSFEYNNTTYEISMIIVEDFVDDNKDSLLYKKIYSIMPEATDYGYGSKLIAKL